MSVRLAIAVGILMGLIVAVPAAATITVIQKGLALDRETASIARGDRITFSNDDDVIHNIHIFGPGGEETDLGLQKPGKPLSYTFDQSGAYRVRCNIHPSVKMTVTVK